MLQKKPRSFRFETEPFDDNCFKRLARQLDEFEKVKTHILPLPNNFEKWCNPVDVIFNVLLQNVRVQTRDDKTITSGKISYHCTAVILIVHEI